MFSCYQYVVHCCRFHGHRPFIVLTGIHNYDNLSHRRNLTPVSNVCEASPRSLFWTSYGLNELPEVRFRISFRPYWQIDIGFSSPK